MTSQLTPPIECTQQHASVFVHDLAAAIESAACSSHEFHRSNGVDVAQPIGDRPWHIRDYTVRDLNGYHIVFGRHLHNAGEPIKVERADLNVRLEKRLSALLTDLAAHKRMTVSSCLEEILLHTNEGVGPHTKSTLQFIQHLKRTHGIDYDSHGSYRFVE